MTSLDVIEGAEGIEPISILLVEDNAADVELTIEALRGARVLNRLSHVWDGVAAMEHLRSQPQPDLIVLDLNMPRMDGREVLQAIRGDAKLKLIPVVVLTTSVSEADVFATYGLGANAYVVKPVDFTQFIDAVRSIETFWLSVVRLPSRP